MNNNFSVMAATRLIAVLVGIGLVCAPFSANCCALSSCEPPSALSYSSPSGTHCHGNMGGESPDSSVCLKNMPSCANNVLALVPGRANEVSGSENVQTKQQLAAAVQGQAAGHFDLADLDSEKLKSPRENLLILSALSHATPLKI